MKATNLRSGIPDHWDSELLVSKHRRYYLRHKVVNGTERGLENKLHSAAIRDVFLPS